jgi:hypothetical protein
MDKLTAAVEATLESLYCQWRATIEETDFAWLTTVVNEDGAHSSAREQIVSSARVVEQAFGGITANLWDDPRDWTLPEVLQTSQQMLEYFDEVEATRRRGMALIRSDADLYKMIVTPSGEMQLLELMVGTCSSAIDHYFRAKKILALVIHQDTRSKLTADVKDRMN